MRVPWRREFDPARDFVVRKPVTAGGRKFAAGETFDHTLVSVRRLRQLFDQHVLVFKGDRPGAIVRRPAGFGHLPTERELAQVLPAAGTPLPGLDEALAGEAQARQERKAARPAPAPAQGAQAPQEPPAPPAGAEPSPEELEARAAAQERARRAAVEIPQDWERQPWNTVRVLAKEIDPSATIGNKDAALAVISDEIAHRAGDS